MTVTPTPRAAPRRGLRVRLAAAAALFAVAGVSLVAVPAGAAETPAPEPAPAPTGIVEFALAPVGNGIVRPGDSLAASVTIRNGTDASTAAGVVAMSLGTAALPDRGALSAWLAGEVAGVGVQELTATEVDPVAPRSSHTSGIRVDAADPALAGLAPGVYPLVATYTAGDEALTSTSAVIVPRDDDTTTGIGVVVPITAGPLTEGLLTATQLDELTAADGSLTNALDAVDGTSAILAIDPAILAAIRVLGTAAPESAAAWLERLDDLANPRFALQFGDADVTAQLEAGASRPADPTSLTYAMDPRDFAALSPTAQPDPSPSPTAESDEPALPSLSELLEVPTARDSVYWPAPGTATAAVVESLAGIADDDEPTLTLVPSTATSAGALGQTVSAHRSVGEAAVLVYDADISRALHEASLLDDNALRGTRLTAATAYLAFAADDAGDAPLLVTLDRGTDRSRVAMRTAILTALQAPGMDALSLAGVANAPAPPVELAPTVSDEARAAAASRFFSDEQSLARFATVLDDPTLLTGPERAEILQLLGVAWTGVPDLWAAAVAEHTATTARTLDAVGLLPPGDIQQIGPSAEIPVWVRNDLPFDANVVLYATPDDLRLDVEPSIEVTARAESNTRVLIPVNAQIGSGDVEIALQLRSPTFQEIGGPQYAQVTVRADWERYGIIALGIIVGGLLVIGIIRTVLRRRAARRADASPGTDDPGSPGAGFASNGAEEPRG